MPLILYKELGLLQIIRNLKKGGFYGLIVYQRLRKRTECTK